VATAAAEAAGFRSFCQCTAAARARKALCYTQELYPIFNYATHCVRSSDCQLLGVLNQRKKF